MAEYMIVKDNVVEAIYCGGVEENENIIMLPENHQVRVGENISFYNNDWSRKSDVELMQLGLIDIPAGFKLENNTLIEMTYEEKVIAGIEKMPANMKIENGKVLPKSENELFNEMTLEEKENFIRNKRKNLINSVLWQIERHKQEKELNINTTLTNEEYLNLLKYIQTLRDIPTQKGFPDNVIFPTL